MKRKVAFGITLGLSLLLGFLTSSGQSLHTQPGTHTVDDDGSAYVAEIKEPIDSPAVIDGTPVQVNSETYDGDGKGDKTISLAGEYRDITIADENVTGSIHGAVSPISPNTTILDRSGEDNSLSTVDYVDLKNGTTMIIRHYYNGTRDVITQTLQLKTLEERPYKTTEYDFMSRTAMSTLRERTTDYTIASIDSVLGNDFLMGFTYRLTVARDWGASQAVYRWHLHAQVDFDFGLRYPVRITLEYPDLMAVDHDHELRAKLTPLDWPDYEELLLRAHVWAWYKSEYWFFGWHTDDYSSYDEYYDYSLSFPTPFGADMSFPLGSLEMKLFDVEEFALDFSIEPQLGSDKITAQVTAGGDATGNQTITFTAPDKWVPFEVHTDDYGPTDFAEIVLSDFRYYLSIFNLKFKLNFDFRGWIEDLLGDSSILLSTLDLSHLTREIYMPVHEGNDRTMEVSIFVQDFGLSIAVSPGTMSIEPGNWAAYSVTVTNEGNVPDTFDMRAGLPLSWEYEFSDRDVSMNPGESRSFQVSVKPRRHFSTSPGDYTFTVVGVSEGAKSWGLLRKSSDVTLVHVLPFYGVELVMNPSRVRVRPGDTAFYKAEVTNLGNVVDTFALTHESSVLSLLGMHVRIDWIRMHAIDPGARGAVDLMISVPSDWAGLMDTIYEFDVTARSLGDRAYTSPASDANSAVLVVEATGESVARYICALVLLWLLERIH